MLELTVVCVLVGIGALAAATMVQNTHQAQVQFKNTSKLTVETAEFQTYFSKLAANGFLNDFLHQPIHVLCTAAHDDTPCIRTSTSGSTFFNMISDPGGGTPWFPASNWYEFHRDHDARFPVGSPIVPMSEDPQSVIQRSIPVTLNPAAYHTTYYATWRLTSDGSAGALAGTFSQPFVVLSRAHITASEFTFDYDKGGTGAQATLAPVGSFAYFAAADGNSFAKAQTELSEWVGTGGLFLIFNQEDPSQYTIQRVINIDYSQGPPDVGFQLHGAEAGSSPFTDQAAGGSASMYAKAATMGYAAAEIWGAGQMSWTQRQGQTWTGGTGAEDFYPFPSDYFSMSRINGAPAFGASDPFATTATAPTAQVDIRKIAYYYYNLPAVASPHQHRPALVGIPIVVTSFYLGPGVFPQGCDASNFSAGGAYTTTTTPWCPTGTFYSLRARTVPGNVETILISALPPTERTPAAAAVGASEPTKGYVTFARQLGTQEIKAVVK